MRRAAMNVVLSEGMSERVRSHGIDAGHIRIVPNWADTTSVTPLAAADSLIRRKLGLSGQFCRGLLGQPGPGT